MEYTKQTWTAPTGTGLSRYAKSGETETHVELALDPVNLTNTPTPFTMARMAHMEEGIAKAYDTAPPTPWAQYSGKDIPQLPDNIAGTTYKKDNDWTTTDGWTASGGTRSVGDNKLICFSSTTDFYITKSGFSFSGASNRFIYLYLSECPAGINPGQVYYTTSGHGISASYYKNFIITKKGIYILDMGVLDSGDNDWITSTITGLRIDLGGSTGQTFILQSIYIGTGAYDRLVFDNSYHYRHLLNNAVVPTPQGLYFNGETSYLRSKEKITLPDVLTFSATVNCAVSSSVYQRIFEVYNNATSLLRVYRSPNANNVSVSFYNTSSASLVFHSVNNFFVDNTDVDIKIEINFINKVIKVYKNNILSYNATVTGIQKPTEEYLYIGTERGIGNLLLGYMRNIQLFDTALTDTQRNWLAQGNTPPILYDVTNYELGNASKANVRVSLRHGDTWFVKTFAGLTDFFGHYVWTDGENIYFSTSIHQFVLNKTTSTWVAKIWTGLTDFSGNCIWTDGENIYNSNGPQQFVLNKATSTWTAKTWVGLTGLMGYNIWTDGENIYYSAGEVNHYVLNKTTSTWTAKTWFGLGGGIFTDFNGENIWTDGENIYYSAGATQLILNKATSTWAVKTWSGLTDFSGQNIWTDGDNIYYSAGTTQYVLNKATSTWTAKTWFGLTGFGGRYIWTDGDNIHHSYSTTQHVLPATRHNYVDDNKYNSLFGTDTKCNCSTLSARFVFRNE